MDGATEYDVYRGDSAGNLTSIATDVTGTTYDDSGLRNGAIYYYAVRASNSVGDGPQSAAVSLRALATPGALGNFTVRAEVSNGVIQAVLSWGQPVIVPTEYYVYRGVGPTGDLVRITTSAPLTLRGYTDGPLVSGTQYRYAVAPVNAAGEGTRTAPFNVTAPTPIAAPANFNATPGDRQVTLSWDAVTGTMEYRVYRFDDFSANIFVLEGTTSASTTTFTDTPVTNGTEYRYVVRSYDGTNESLNSSEVRVTPAVPAPGIPTNLTATAGAGQVELSWTAAAGAHRYRVRRANTPSGALGRIAHSTTITGTTFTDTGLTNGDTYRYVVVTENRLGALSAVSNEASATPSAASGHPVAPTNLLATATPSTVVGVSAQIALTWTAVSGATEYQVYRGVTGGTLTRIGVEIPGNSGINRITTASYTDTTGLTNGTAYRYAVSAVNAAGIGAMSTEVTATPTSNAAVPAAPTNLSATQGLSAGNSNVTLTWTAGARATEYNIYRSDAATGALTRIATTARITGTTYTDFLLAGGTDYRYAVRSANVAGESGDSNIVNVTAITPIAAPENLSGTVGSAAQVELSWNAVSGATEYRVYRSPNSLHRTLTRVAGSITGTTYTNTGLTRGATYWYVVRAVNSTGESTNSNEIRILVPRVPSAPASLSATSGDTLVSLSWAAVDNATEYRIYRSASSTGSLTQIASNATITGTAYTNTGLTNGTAYRYAVRAVNAAGESSNSTVVNATPNSLSSAPSDPRNLTGTPGNAQVTLSWGPVRGASEYYVFRSAVSSGLLERIDENTTIAATTYTDTGLTNLTTYRYSVRAVNSRGQSLESTIISVTPDDHGNSQAAATTLTLESTVTGNIGPANDVDFFAIPVSTNRVENVLLTATTTGPGGTTGVILGQFPDPGNPNSDSNGNNPLNVRATITESGTYYLRVDGATGNYSLTVTAVAVPAFDDDHGNTGTTATPITSGTAVSGILGAFDNDFFSIEVTGASGSNPVTITVATTGTAGAFGYINESDESEIARHNGNASNVSLTSSSITENGVYYIILSAFTIPIGNYTLTATVQ